MSDLALLVEESVKGSKAIECFDQLILETFIAIDSHLDKIDCDVYDFDM